MVAGKTSHVEVEEAAPDPPAPSSSAREAFHLVVIVQNLKPDGAPRAQTAAQAHPHRRCMSLGTAGEFEIDLFAAMYKPFTDGLDTLGLNRAQGLLHSP